MNKNLKDITLRQEYTGVISFEILKLISSRYVPRTVWAIVYRKKIRNVSLKGWQRFFSKETFLVYPTLTNFTQGKRKTCEWFISAFIRYYNSLYIGGVMKKLPRNRGLVKGGEVLLERVVSKACFHYYRNTFFCLVNIHTCCNQ